MRANEYFYGVDVMGHESDELCDLIADCKLEDKLQELDSHWTEVMKLAEKYGFIMQSYGGVATLATNFEYRSVNGSKALADRLRMQNVEL